MHRGRTCALYHSLSLFFDILARTTWSSWHLINIFNKIPFFFLRRLFSSSFDVCELDSTNVVSSCWCVIPSILHRSRERHNRFQRRHKLGRTVPPSAGASEKQHSVRVRLDRICDGHCARATKNVFRCTTNLLSAGLCFFCVFLSVCDCKERDRLVHRRYNLYLTAENELLEGEMTHNSSCFFFSFVEMAHCGACVFFCVLIASGAF